MLQDCYNFAVGMIFREIYKENFIMNLSYTTSPEKLITVCQLQQRPRAF